MRPLACPRCGSKLPTSNCAVWICKGCHGWVVFSRRHQEKCTSLDINLLLFFYLFNALHQIDITFCCWSKLLNDTFWYSTIPELICKKQAKKAYESKKKKKQKKEYESNYSVVSLAITNNKKKPVLKTWRVSSRPVYPQPRDLSLCRYSTFKNSLV